MISKLNWKNETPDRLINQGDPEAVTQCPNCGCIYRNGIRVEKPIKSWARIAVGNWRRYGWRITVDFGGIIPLGYGLSWMEENRLATVLHPMPFNVVMRTVREMALWMMRGGWVKFPSVQEQIDYHVGERLKRERGVR